MSIQALRERLAASNKEAQNILAEKGSQTWTAEDQAKYDNLMDEAERTARQIEAHQRQMNIEAEDATKNIPRHKPGQEGKVSDGARALDVFMRKFERDYSDEEAALIRNTMSTTTGSEGGHTVQTEVARQVIEVVKTFGAMRRLAGSVTTTQGNPMSWVTSDATSEEGERIAENQPASDLDPSVGTRPLGVHKYSSKVISVPMELLQDSAVDVQALVQRIIRTRLGRIQNREFTFNNSGSDPVALIQAASTGKVAATGNTTTITYDDLVDLIDSLDVAYTDDAETMPQFMTNQVLRRTLRKLKDSSGRPLWTPSYDLGISGKHGDMLLGYEVVINNDMPTPAANAKSLSFGQHNRYMIRDAMALTLFRFDDSAFVRKGQIGFLAWMRSGGNLMDLGAVKTFQHSAT